MFNVPALIVSKPQRKDPSHSKMTIINAGEDTDSIETLRTQVDSRALKHLDIDPMKIWTSFTLHEKGSKWKNAQAENKF